jgi:phosphoribosyl-AMP cyclohydrolase
MATSDIGIEGAQVAKKWSVVLDPLGLRNGCSFRFSPRRFQIHWDMALDPKQITFGARDTTESVEQGLVLAPKFDAEGLIPAMAVDWRTNEPLMLAYMSEESLKQTLALGQAVYYSRSRKQLWHKGATSGEFQIVKEIRVDCDQDTLVLKVEQLGGGCCHTKAPTCFYRRVATDEPGGAVRLVRD